MIIGIDARPLISDKPSGIGVYLSEVLNVFKKSSNDNVFILYSNKPISSKYSFPNNFQIRVIPGKIGTLWLRYIVSKYLSLDGVNVFWGTQHILPKKVGNVKFVLTVHDLALLVNPRWGSHINAIMQNIFCRASIQDADVIMTVSESTRKDIIRLCNVNEEKTKTIYLGRPKIYSNLDVNEEKELLKSMKINRPYYLYLGTIEPRKNIDTIIAAFEKIQHEKSDTQLVLAGGLGWKYEPILKKIEESQCKDNIILTGYVSENQKSALYHNCIAFVFPSHYEGFGIPVLEAMENHSLVITSNNSSLSEVGGKAVMYIQDENDVVELANMMAYVRYLDNSQKKELLEKEQYQLQKFSWFECGVNTLNILEGVLYG